VVKKPTKNAKIVPLQVLWEPKIGFPKNFLSKSIGFAKNFKIPNFFAIGGVMLAK
jgi:hypothetical protein